MDFRRTGQFTVAATPSRSSSSSDDARSSGHDAFGAGAAPFLHPSASAGGGEKRRKSDGASVRVLVVDDHADMLGMMQLMMARQSYTVETANSGKRALEIAPEMCPHVVVSDIGMPEMDGLELMRAMRSDSRLVPFKSIALTGFGLPCDKAEARDAGFDVCLTKPVDFNCLFERIDDLVATLSVESMARRDIKLEGAAEIDPEKGGLI
jgi:CheY-like chemotaxis protein